MRATLLGTRGSVGRAGPTTVRYGGDTSSVEVASDDGSILLLDAGSGVVHASEEANTGPVHILLTHLHMDHIQGLGFLRPLFDPNTEVHIWAPSGGSRSLAAKLGRYLSPPLFPVRLRDIPALVRQVEARHPDRRIRITEPLGASSELPDLILRSASKC